MTAAALAFREAPHDTPPAPPPTAPKKRGPKTPESRARSAMNALKHGLRARSFGLLPEEDQAEWAEHVHDLRQGYGPVDAAEEKLVTAIAVAMWNEIRADRTLVETMAEIPPRRPGRTHGTDTQDPTHARSLGTAIRYLTAAGMATQRAQRAFFHHRKAKQSGLILPAAEPVATGQPELHERIPGGRPRPHPGHGGPGRCRGKMHERIPAPQPTSARARASGPSARADRRRAGPARRRPDWGVAPLGIASADDAQQDLSVPSRQRLGRKPSRGSRRHAPAGAGERCL